MSAEIESLTHQIEEINTQLLTIAERESEYAEATDIPLSLVNEKRRKQKRLQQLQEQLMSLTLSPEQTGEEQNPKPPAVPCPYRGLEAFEAEHASNYFGRQAMIDKLVEKVNEANFVAVVGPSGSGKSSLVRAGLVTALKQHGKLPGSRNWEIVIIRPLDDPLRSLAQMLVDQLDSGLSPAKRIEEIRTMANGLQSGTIPIADVLAALRQKPGYPQRLVVIIDQFEETFTLGGDSDEAKATRRTFLNTLLTASETKWLNIVFTLRADFYGHILAEERFGKRVDAGLVNVLPMTPEERRAAIEQPALAAGRRFEEGLVARILDDLEHEAGELPLLEFALTELWERATPEGVLTHAAYEAIGEVSGAIAKRAEQTLQSLKPDEQQIVRRIFTRLVRVTQPEENAEDTKRRIALHELEATYQPLIQKLADARLLVTGRDEQSGSETIEVAHEALIRNWRELQSWLNSDREFLLWRQRLRTQVSGWLASGNDKDALLRGVQLNESEGWSNSRSHDLSEQEREYIAASRAQVDSEAKAEEERRQRELRLIEERAEAEKQKAETQAQANLSLRRRALWLAGALVAALLAAGIAFFFFGQANSARRTAEASSEKLAVEVSTRTAAEVVAKQAADSEAIARQTAEAGSFALATQVAVRATAEANAKQAADNEATQRNAAEQQSRLAQARYLANQAAFYRNSDPQLALLLARQAISSTYNADGYTTVEANAALRGLLQPTYLPRRLTGGHTASIFSVSFSSDAKLLASAGGDNSIVLWDITTGKPISTFKQHSTSVYAVAFSPDGKMLVSGSGDSSVILWDVNTGKPLTILKQHSDAVNDVAFSPDGRMFASGSNDTSIILWEVRTGKPIFTLKQHSAAVYAVSFSPDGKTLASSSFDTSIILWDVSTGKPISTFKQHPKSVSAIAFSPDGKMLASGSDDTSIILWDVSTGKPISTLNQHSAAVYTVAFSPDGKMLASGSDDTSIILWDLSTDKPISTLKQYSVAVYSVAFSTDSKTLASASREPSISLWNTEPKPEPERVNVEGPQVPVWHTLFSPNGENVAAAGQDGIVYLWDAITGGNKAQLSGHGNITNVNQDCPACIQTIAFDPAGDKLLSAGWDGTIRLWNLEDSQANTFIEHKGRLSDVKFSPDGRMFATASAEDGNIFIWDTQKAIVTLVISNTPANQVNFSPDGGLLTAAGNEGPLYIINTNTGERTIDKQDRQGLINANFSPDGKYVASAGFDGHGYIWDVATEKTVITLTGHTKAIYNIVYSKQGDMIATASDDGTARIWDAVTGEVHYILQGHTAGVRNVAFRPDGQQIATAGIDGTLRLWSLKTGRLETILPDSKGVENLISWGVEEVKKGVVTSSTPVMNSILDINYDQSGSRIVTAGLDGSVVIYVAPVDLLLKIADTQITRDFTCQERVQFLSEKLECPVEAQATPTN